MRRVTTVLLLVVALAVAGRPTAQTTQSDQGKPATQTQATSTTTDAGTTRDTRPATTTFFGDTGLWFVPTADILPNGKWSASGYLAGFNDQQGYTNIVHYAATFGVGIKDRAELF